ncbi:MAG: quinone-dependent dihydroorotate dehydrogenase [Trueperaceae bacterium]|nr:quinone-dependent dihydroorotate dehydrogenase [Trueperaceae bacterium]
MNAYDLAKPYLFRLDPEKAHDLVIRALALASRSVLAPRVLELIAPAPDPRLEVELFGLRFPNPLGLAAGLDKNGVAFPALAALGFGAVEVGSVTALAQPGNPRPRLFRLLEDEALINRMGFNNLGAAAMAERLGRLDRRELRGRAGSAILGVNVGKSRAADVAAAAADYRASLTLVWPHADYLVVNVSSPNTPGLRTLQRSEPLAELFGVVAELRAALGHKPVLLKLAPDLGDGELVDLVATAEEVGVDGLVAANTTLAREGLRSPHRDETGGLSGRPLTARALAVLELLRGRTSLPIVAVGGIFGARDALDRLAAGADLLQVYTGFIYHGPALVGEVLTGIARELDRRGAGKVTELSGRK